MLVIYVNFLAQPQESKGECRELLTTTAWRQFPAILSAPAVESKFVCWLFMWTLSSTAGAEGRAGNCCQLLLGGSSLPFSPLLRLSWEFSHTKQEIEIPNNTDPRYKKCRILQLGRAVSFLGIYVSNFRYSMAGILEHPWTVNTTPTWRQGNALRRPFPQLAAWKWSPEWSVDMI